MKRLVAWSPHSSEQYSLLTSEFDLSLFQFSSDKKALWKPTHVLSDVNPIRCMAWGVLPEDPMVVCIGNAAGKAVVARFGTQVRREYVPKYPRACNTVSFGPGNVVAVGLDKVRNDHCTLLYDIASLAEEPVVKLSNNEAVASSSWIKSSLAIGTGFKWMRIYDVRSNSQPLSVIAHAKTVSCADSLLEYNIATASDEGVVKIWDMRKLTDPALNIAVDGPYKRVEQISWDPIKRGSIAVLCKNESFLRFYDVSVAQPQTNHQDGILESVVKLISPFGSNSVNSNAMPSSLSYVKRNFSFPVSSFSLHYKDVGRVLCSSSDDNRVEDDEIRPVIQLSWFGNGFGYSLNGRVIMVEEDSNSVEDIMRENASLLSVIPSENALNTILCKNKYRSNFWWTMHGLLMSNKSKDKQGIISMLNNDTSVVQSSNVNGSMFSVFPVYISDARFDCLVMCGWMDDKSGREINIDISRKIAILIFKFDIAGALELLNSNAESNIEYSMMALAVSGFTEIPNRVWQRTCENCLNTIKTPSLRMALRFLARIPYNGPSHLFANISYSSVLLEPFIELSDRIGFCLLFLPDSELVVVLNYLLEDCKRNLFLEGLLLCGFGTGALGNDGIDLMQRYIDVTNDIQTIAILAAHCVIPKCDEWVQTYRNLLDRWKAWHVRAKFDSFVTVLHPKDLKDKKASTQIFARCQYCNNPLSLPRLSDPSTNTNSVRRPPGGGLGGLRSARLGGLGLSSSSTTEETANNGLISSGSKTRSTACPSCKKPLPHCTLCLLPINCAPPSLKVKGDDKDGSLDTKSANKFENWFTWCQNCRHGGHAGHLKDWFSTHTSCPVTDCPCFCGKYVGIQ